MAAVLWCSADAAEWRQHLTAYPDRIAAKNKDGLAELDSWYRALPQTINARGDQPHITAEELVRIVDWKLKRGKFRPRLLSYAQEHSDATVQDASSEASRQASSGRASDVAGALAPLTKLKGIGPATASAVLAVAQPAYPFMSDEAMGAAVKGPLKYTVPEYVQLVEALQGKAAELNKGDGDHVWTASDVEWSLWSSAAADAVPKAKRAAKAPAKGRKQAKGQAKLAVQQPAGTTKRGRTGGSA